MNPTDLASILDTLKIISRLELAMAEFYGACAEVWEAEKPFWLSLKQEELQHIQNLAKMANIVAQRQAQFERNRSFNAVAIRTFISYVETTTQRARTGQIPKPDLSHILAIARDMEQSILESKFVEIVKTGDVEYLTIVRKILADTAAHKKKIVAQLAAATKGK
jgi:rubrerythrin